MPDSQFPFPEGTQFTLTPQPPMPPPRPKNQWLLPLVLACLTAPALMVGWGVIQQQPPVSPAASATPTPISSASTQASPDPSLQSTTQPTTPAPVQTATAIAPQTAPIDAQPSPVTDTATLPIARIHSPGMAANVRQAPTLRCQVIGSLQDGDLVELSRDRLVIQDGVTWVPVRYRGQSAWIASNFVSPRSN